MNSITSSMARLNISSEMLESIDTVKILDNFRHDFKKLGDFKKAREKHESRNALSRWWNSDELKNAQLDSIELQESFSQKLGQLMVISVAMSQQLNEQQQSLGVQQLSLQKQTDDIAVANDRISEQQQALTEQQERLKKLIDEYFELKGLTANQARELIQIASEVKTAKERLTAAFMQERDAVLAIKNEIDAAAFQQQQSFQILCDRQNQKVQEKLQEVSQALDEGRKLTRQELEQAAAAATKLHAVIKMQLESAQANMAEQVSRQDSHFKRSSEQLEMDVREKLQNAITVIDGRFAEQQSEVNNALGQQHERIERRCSDIEQASQQQANLTTDAQRRLSEQIYRLKWLATCSGAISGAALVWLTWMQISN